MYSSIAYIVYIALCVSGLTWQVYEHSYNYFLFDVSTSIQLQFSGEYPYLFDCNSMLDISLKRRSMNVTNIFDI